MAKGFSQVEGLDFGETFGPVARLEAICILLAYSSHHNIKLYQMDVKSAFLNDIINELVYVEQPPGLKIRGILTMFIGCTRHSMGSNKFQGLGMRGFVTS